MTQNLKIHYPLKYDYKGVFSLPKSNMGGMCYGRVDGTPTLSQGRDENNVIGTKTNQLPFFLPECFGVSKNREYRQFYTD